MQRVPEAIICSLLLVTFIFIYSVTAALKSLLNYDTTKSGASSLEDSWLFRLPLNVLGYATIIVPGVIVYLYVKKISYFERSGHGCFPSIVKLCFVGSEPVIGLDTSQTSGASQKPSRSTVHEGLLLMFCFLGLQISYLTWGILQEKIMTQEYYDASGAKGHFRDSQFLVFVNRILAFALAAIYIATTRQPRHTAPLYKYVYCSFSNIMSSWCQYEALKYVSFPTQVLAKASKIIPVMLMGKCVSQKKYEYYEYVTAILISLGMALFFLDNSDHQKDSGVTTVSGVILLIFYMLFDSFTSNWQKELFDSYKMSSVQMMYGVNLFSCLFTAVSLAQQGGFIHSLNFMSQFPKFMFDCIVLSLCSAAGQLFIFYTIATFSPVVFVIIMTIRQGLAILLSCLIYQHDVTAIGILGVIIVFVAIFLRIYCNQRIRAMKRRKAEAQSTPKV